MKKQLAETQSESKGNNPPLNAQLSYYIYNVSYLFLAGTNVYEK